jgi:tRNA A37 threonylcarbamoyladenosine biosynthesis protein TsaE
VILHIDLYRIADAAELQELGLEAPAADEVWVIEWPERAGAALPADRLEVELRQGDAPDARIAEVTAGPSWKQRLETLRGA